MKCRSSEIGAGPWDGFPDRSVRHRAGLAGVSALLAVLLPATGYAQILPSEPIRVADGRLIVSGEITASFSQSEKRGYFNYTDYEHSALRIFRLSASSALALGDRVSVLVEARTENRDTFQIHALYVRLHPWPARPIDIQVGRIPPTFGAQGRRGYGADNTLIGYPLSYQYLTSLRADALPANADDLLRMRGRGWRPSYPIGAKTPHRGLPLMTALRWDTGVQLSVGRRPVQIVAAVTNGSLSNPLVQDDNASKQIVVRAMFEPWAALILGVSAARGGYLSRRALDSLSDADGESFIQRALGADVEYSRDHWILRAEAVLSEWQLPAIEGPLIEGPVRAFGFSAEGRYRMRPGWYLAARADRLGFSRIVGTLFGGRPTPWDAPVSRIEVGTGYSLRRNVVAKVAYQHNWRDDPFDRRSRFVSAQLVYWF